MAGITADNAVSLRLHEKLGFVEVAHIREVGYKFGRWLDLKLLQIVLDGPRQPTDR
jgi:phosphinothricin acetyltransferase